MAYHQQAISKEERAMVFRRKRVAWWGRRLLVPAKRIASIPQPSDTRYTLSLTAHEVDLLVDIISSGVVLIEHQNKDIFAGHEQPAADDPLYQAFFRKEGRNSGSP